MRYSRDQMESAFNAGWRRGFDIGERQSSMEPIFDKWLSSQKEEVCECVSDGQGTWTFSCGHKWFVEDEDDYPTSRGSECCNKCGKRIEVKL